MNKLRVVVCGDEGVGKSSLITSLVKEKFIPNIQSTLPQITVPRDPSNSAAPESTIIIDTNASDINQVQKAIRQADVIWLVYADHYTYERISLYWMMMFRAMGVNLPVVLCANKSDLVTDPVSPNGTMMDELVPLVRDFKEIESCIRCSAKNHLNVVQAFYLCQRAVTHPIAPLFDYKEGSLKPLCEAALKRIFFLCDKDQDGFLCDSELLYVQQKCFNKDMSEEELQNIKSVLETQVPGSCISRGVTADAFLALHKFYAESGRHETIWGVLRAFHYTDSLSLNDKFLYPQFDVPQHASVELSPKGYRFLVDLFLLFDKDNDGGLNASELSSLFQPTPGIPQHWIDHNFPQTIVCNEQGHVTLQGWLAQWSMTTYLDHKTTLTYLGYLGFESDSRQGAVTSALKITRPRKIRQKNKHRYRMSLSDRTVFNCFVVGAPQSGKTSLLESFLGKQYSEMYSPTIHPRIAVNSVELKGGKQCYLILQELGELEDPVLENRVKLETCDILVYTYDSADPDSFQFLVYLREKFRHLDELPVVFVALKADLDRQQQRCGNLQPEPYTRSIHVPPPLHISSSWSNSVNELVVQIVETAKLPRTATPGLEPEVDKEDLRPIVIAASALGFMAVASVWFLRGWSSQSG